MLEVNLFSLNEVTEGSWGNSSHLLRIDLSMPNCALVILISPNPRYIVRCYEYLSKLTTYHFLLENISLLQVVTCTFTIHVGNNSTYGCLNAVGLSKSEVVAWKHYVLFVNYAKSDSRIMGTSKFVLTRGGNLSFLQ